MTTFVGTQTNFIAVIKDLIELDFDAISAYKAAIDRLKNNDFKKKLEEFKNDHERHTHELTKILEAEGEKAPTGGSPKHFLTQGKVVLANLMGDKAILMAMKTNEDDTNTAYERANAHPKKIDAAIQTMERGLADERRHRQWIEETIAKL